MEIFAWNQRARIRLVCKQSQFVEKRNHGWIQLAPAHFGARGTAVGIGTFAPGCQVAGHEIRGNVVVARRYKAVVRK
jgi:phage gp16-like protein